MRLFAAIFIAIISTNSYAQDFGEIRDTRINCNSSDLVKILQQRLALIGIDASTSISVSMSNIRTGVPRELIGLFSSLTIKNKEQATASFLEEPATISFTKKGKDFVRYDLQGIVEEFEAKTGDFHAEECNDYKKLLAVAELELEVIVKKDVWGSGIKETYYAQNRVITEVTPAVSPETTKKVFKNAFYSDGESNKVRYPLIKLEMIKTVEALGFFNNTTKNRRIGLFVQDLSRYPFFRENDRVINDNLLPVSFNITIELAKE